MSGSPQNPRPRLSSSRSYGLPDWSSRPLWEGLAVAFLAIAAATLGSIVLSREAADRAPLQAMSEGLELLEVERDVSIVASDFIATLTMQMYEGSHDEELETRRRELQESMRGAAARLDSMAPSEAWERTHGDMSAALEFGLETFDERRTHDETFSWLTEVLYDFKRVIPTDNMGEWSALLEVATWSQEIPLVLQDYLDVGMAREWQLTGREPADPDLVEAYNISLATMRQVRESHGSLAAEYTPFEEYILPDLAEEADSASARLTAEIAAHPGVRRLEADTPYLLGLTDRKSFDSVDEVYELRDRWVPELAALVEELRRHAAGRLDDARRSSLARARAAQYGGLLVVVLALVFGVRLIRQRLRHGQTLRSALEQDPLTGLANRYALFAVAPQRLPDPAYRDFALIHVDLDDFKSINDDYGHHIGDVALIKFARALQGAVRSATDLVCRVGGDEFVILLHKLSDAESEAEAVIQRLKDALETPVDVEVASLRLHFTAGIAIAREEVDLEELLVEADLALLDAKERGRDLARVFRRKLGRKMIHELSTALGSGELRCAFQPQVDMDSGSIIGLEALARWRREDRIQIPTRSLIDAIEWLGASREWLRVAMRDIELAWRHCGHRINGRLWINLMGCDLEEASADELLEIFSSTDVPLGRIGLEITEAVGRSRLDDVVARLHTLREAGLAIALDDVGDDRVPLLHVTELPIDLVKLDRCVITGIDLQRPLRAIVRSLSEMCDRLDLRILAEGVETVEEEAILRRLGIRYVQGFLYASPMGLRDLRAYLDRPIAEHSTGSVA